MAVYKQYEVTFVNKSKEAVELFKLPERTRIIIVDGVTNMNDARVKALDMLYPEVKFAVGFQTKAQVAQDWRIVKTRNVTRASSAQQAKASAQQAKRKAKRAKRSNPTINGATVDTSCKTVSRADVEAKLAKLQARMDDAATTEAERKLAADAIASIRNKYASILRNELKVA